MVLRLSVSLWVVCSWSSDERIAANFSLCCRGWTCVCLVSCPDPELENLSRAGERLCGRWTDRVPHGAGGDQQGPSPEPSRERGPAGPWMLEFRLRAGEPDLRCSKPHGWWQPGEANTVYGRSAGNTGRRVLVHRSHRSVTLCFRLFSKVRMTARGKDFVSIEDIEAARTAQLKTLRKEDSRAAAGRGRDHGITALLTLPTCPVGSEPRPQAAPALRPFSPARLLLSRTWRLQDGRDPGAVPEVFGRDSAGTSAKHKIKLLFRSRKAEAEAEHARVTFLPPKVLSVCVCRGREPGFVVLHPATPVPPGGVPLPVLLACGPGGRCGLEDGENWASPGKARYRAPSAGSCDSESGLPGFRFSQVPANGHRRATLPSLPVRGAGPCHVFPAQRPGPDPAEHTWSGARRQFCLLRLAHAHLHRQLRARVWPPWTLPRWHDQHLIPFPPFLRNEGDAKRNTTNAASYPPRSLRAEGIPAGGAHCPPRCAPQGESAGGEVPLGRPARGQPAGGAAPRAHSRDPCAALAQEWSWAGLRAVHGPAASAPPTAHAPAEEAAWEGGGPAVGDGRVRLARHTQSEQASGSGVQAGPPRRSWTAAV
ncbi:PREDICTED: uncharacterized protein LOC102022049 [Chinchilla lanigera]|uniref:uncharacterized protein LOC102022049 n=1 Tax=Chinchilla lanigera TaxID=34839 RepID=UPI00038EEC9B|nr:PREDICTED: uncharacterized protein LOC102022049 [Chinchilla lanigera]